MHFFLFYQTNLKNHTGIWCFLSSRPHPSPVDRVRGFGFRAVSFFNLLQDGIDRFRSVPPACVTEEGFTADGITVECGSINGIGLRAGKGVEGVVAEDVDEDLFEGGHRDTVRDFDRRLAHLRRDDDKFPAGRQAGQRAFLRIAQDQ